MTAQPSDTQPSPLAWAWKPALVLIAAAYAWPVYWAAEERVQEVTRKQREQLIMRHQLWELEPAYAGTPQAWTRFAAMLLSDRQLLRRVDRKYGALGRDIELDYRRDLFIAQAEVVLTASAIWALPLAALYGIGAWVGRHRRRMAPPETDSASVSDSRYRP
jgi:hypothetical protein